MEFEITARKGEKFFRYVVTAKEDTGCERQIAQLTGHVEGKELQIQSVRTIGFHRKFFQRFGVTPGMWLVLHVVSDYGNKNNGTTFSNPKGISPLAERLAAKLQSAGLLHRTGNFFHFPPESVRKIKGHDFFKPFKL